MRYSSKLPPAIIDLSFEIPHGSKISVVGRTGSGKSSLFQLIQGFRYAFRGEVSVGSHNVKQLSIQKLRESLNVVLQQPFIINGATIKENLDPAGKFSEFDLVFALEGACLGQFTPESPCSAMSTGQI